MPLNPPLSSFDYLLPALYRVVKALNGPQAKNATIYGSVTSKLSPSVACTVIPSSVWTCVRLTLCFRETRAAQVNESLCNKKQKNPPQCWQGGAAGILDISLLCRLHLRGVEYHSKPDNLRVFWQAALQLWDYSLIGEIVLDCSLSFIFHCSLMVVFLLIFKRNF